jgi:hypothetical protein
MSSAAKKKRPRLQRKLEDKDYKVPGSQKSAPKGHSKDPLGHSFINISIVDFDPYPADSIEIVVISSDFLLYRGTLINSIWNNHDDYYNTDTSLSSLSDDILEIVPQTGKDYYSPWITLLEITTINLLDNSESWNFNVITNTIFSPISFQEDWILSGPDTSLLYLTSILIELINPEFRNTLPSSISSLLVIANSVEDTHGSIPIIILVYIESSII